MASSTGAGRGAWLLALLLEEGRGLWPCRLQRGGACGPALGRGAWLLTLLPTEGRGFWPFCRQRGTEGHGFSP